MQQVLSVIDDIEREFAVPDRSVNQSHVSVLFMNNMTAHYSENVEHTAAHFRVRCELIPPNCTPHLQSLDHSLNAKFKRHVGQLYDNWWRIVGQYRRTKANNYRRATRDDLNQWIATAWHSITSDHLVRCWEHTRKSVVTAAQKRMAERRARSEDNVVISPTKRQKRAASAQATEMAQHQHPVNECEEIVPME